MYHYQQTTTLSAATDVSPSVYHTGRLVKRLLLREMVARTQSQLFPSIRTVAKSLTSKHELRLRAAESSFRLIADGSCSFYSAPYCCSIFREVQLCGIMTRSVAQLLSWWLLSMMMRNGELCWEGVKRWRHRIFSRSVINVRDKVHQKRVGSYSKKLDMIHTSWGIVIPYKCSNPLQNKWAKEAQIRRHF